MATSVRPQRALPEDDPLDALARKYKVEGLEAPDSAAPAVAAEEEDPLDALARKYGTSTLRGTEHAPGKPPEELRMAPVVVMARRPPGESLLRDPVSGLPYDDDLGTDVPEGDAAFSDVSRGPTAQAKQSTTDLLMHGKRLTPEEQASQDRNRAGIKRGLQGVADIARQVLTNPQGFLAGLAMPLVDAARPNIPLKQKLESGAQATAMAVWGPAENAVKGLIFRGLEKELAESLVKRVVAHTVASATTGAAMGPIFAPDDPLAGSVTMGVLGPLIQLIHMGGAKTLQAADRWAFFKAEEINFRRAEAQAAAEAAAPKQIPTVNPSARAKIVEEPGPPEGPDFTTGPAETRVKAKVAKEKPAAEGPDFEVSPLDPLDQLAKQHGVALEKVDRKNAPAGPERIAETEPAVVMTPDGEYFRATTHPEAVAKAVAAGALPESALEDHLAFGAMDGFFTSTNRFVDRAEAEEIADKAGQIDETSVEHQTGIPGELGAKALKKRQASAGKLESREDLHRTETQPKKEGPAPSTAAPSMAIIDREGVAETVTDEQLDENDNHHQMTFSEAALERESAGAIVFRKGKRTTVTVSPGSKLTDDEIRAHVSTAGLSSEKLEVIRQAGYAKQADEVYTLGPKTAKAKPPAVAFHGTTQDFKDFNVPAFFSEKEEAAHFYATDDAQREDAPPRIVRAQLDIKNPLEIDTESGVRELVRIARAAGVNINFTEDEHGWLFEAGEITEYSNNDGTSPDDLFYIPRVREAVMAAGYDGVKTSDVTGRDETPAWIVLDPKRVKLLEDEPAAITAARDKAENLRSTHLNETRARQVRRQNLYDRFRGTLKDNDVGHVAHIVMGLPGSGKTSAVSERLIRENRAVAIDADLPKEQLPEYDNGIGGTAVHREASAIMWGRVLPDAMQHGFNVVITTVGAEAASLREKVDALEAAGYTVQTHFVDIPTIEAEKRLTTRYIQSGRWVDPAAARKIDQASRESYESLRNHPAVTDAFEWDNDVPRGEPAKLVRHVERRPGDTGGEEAALERGGGGEDRPGESAAGPEGAGGVNERSPRKVRDAAPRELEGERAGDVEGTGGERPAAALPPGGGRVGRAPLPGRAPGTAAEEPGADGRDRAEPEADGGVAASGGGREPRSPPGAGRGDKEGSSDGLPGLANYRITPDDKLGEGGLKAKATANVAAIRLLKSIQADGRVPTRAEQRALAQYVGWGALPGMFVASDKEYGKLAGELKELLTEEEWRQARASTKNAHFTSPVVIGAIYDALRQLGVKGGRFLEPSMGVGNFVGLTPSDFKVHWSGVELDPISGGISKLLYPKGDVRVQGFEKFKEPDGSFDVVIGNIPFGNYTLHDPRYNALKLTVHNYFFAKALDLARPGGLVAFVTSRYTLDAENPGVRHYLAAKAELIGAIRLPGGAFLKNAGTQVITDIILLRKYEEGVSPHDRYWEKVREIPAGSGTAIVNDYFANRPEMMLGEPKLGRGMFRDDEFMLEMNKAADLADLLERAVAKLPAGMYHPLAPNAPGTRTPAAEVDNFLPAPTHVKERGFALVDGKLLQRIEGRLRPAQVAQTQRARVHALTAIKEAYRDVLRTQLEDASDAEITKARTALNKLYDAFVKKFGLISTEKRTESERTDKEGKKHTQVTISYPNLQAFQADPDWFRVRALEIYDADTNTAKKADALLRRTIDVRQIVTRADTPADALPIVLADIGKIDLERIAGMVSGMSVEDVKTSLRGLIYENPEGGEFEIADRYLSGNVRAKLVLAKEAAAKEPRFRDNVTALEKVQPADLLPSEIAAHLGSPWVPASDVELFIDELLGVRGAEVQRIKHDAVWKVMASWSQTNSVAATTQFGTPRASAIKLIDDALNLRSTVIYDPDPNDPKKRVQNPEQTLAAQEKQQAIKDRFEKWIWEDDKRAQRLARYYNDNYNNVVEGRRDGSHLTFPGAVTYMNGVPFELDAHQKDGVWRIIQDGNTMLAWVVGAGKTFAMVAAGMELKRMGLIRKPLYIFPNHMLGQWAQEFGAMYPTAELLVTTKQDMEKGKRQAFAAKAAAHNWDAILMTHSSFAKMRMSPEFQVQYVNEEIDQLEAVIREAKEGKSDRSIVKTLETALAKRRAKLEGLLNDENKDDLLNFEELGVDHLFVDEMHLFKNLEFYTKMRGVTAPASKRAFDLYLKSRYLDGLNPGRGLVAATGTPIANAVAEAYTMMRYLQKEDLDSRGMAHFDGWAATFGKTVTALELGVTGNYRIKERFSKFENVPELFQLLRQKWDVKLAEDLKLETPKVTKRTVVAPSTPQLRGYVESLGERAIRVSKKKVDPSVDNFLKITVDGRHAGLDMRLVDANAPDLPDSKVNVAIGNIFAIWKETKAVKGTQLVFLDLSVPGSDPSSRGGVPGLSIYEDIKAKLIAKGVPEREIKFMQEAKTDAQKLLLQSQVREGRIRVLIGSTEGMGAGMNVQRRLVHLHDLDAPWRPADLEQRHGRIIRRGNDLYNTKKIEGVGISQYVTEGSFDAYMWQGIERKGGMIAQAMKGGGGLRSIEDVDEVALSAGEIKALASGNPDVMRKAGIDADVVRLERLRGAHVDNKFRTEREIVGLPARIAAQEKLVTGLKNDIARRQPTDKDNYKIVLEGKEITKRTEAGEALMKLVQAVILEDEQASGLSLRRKAVGSFAGFDLEIEANRAFVGVASVILAGDVDNRRNIARADSPESARASLEALPKSLEKLLAELEPDLENSRKRLVDLKAEVGKPFEHEAKLAGLKTEQKELDAKLEKAGREPTAPAESGITLREEDEGRKSWEIDPFGHPGDSGTTLYAITDPVTLVAAMIKEMLKLRAQAKREARPLAPSTLPEVEERWQASKGITPLNIRQKIERALLELRKGTRHYKEIDVSESPMNAQLHDYLLEVEHAKEWAAVTARDWIADAIEGLTAGEVDTFTRSLALNDILKDIEAGLYDDGNALPFGYADKAQVEADLVRVNDIVDRSDKLMDALDKRRSFQGAVTDRLVELKLLDPRVLDDPRYYHRQVMTHHDADANNFLGIGTPQDVRIHKKGFQRMRVGGSDFNTAYQEAEFEWVSQAVRMIHMAETLSVIKRLADLTPQLKATARALNLERYKEVTGEKPETVDDMRDVLGDEYVEWRSLIPDTHRQWQPEQGNYFYPALTLEQRALDAALAGLQEFGEVTKPALVVGARRETWVIPLGLAQTLDHFGRVRDLGALEQAWVKLIGGWKQWQLLSPARLLKYNLNNLSGDFDGSLLYPRIILHAPGAIADLTAWMLKRNASPALEAVMQELTRLRVIGNTLSVAEIPDVTQLPEFKALVEADPLSFMKLIAKYWQHARLLTQFRENILRLSAFRYFEGEIKAGRGEHLLGASNPVQVRAEKDPRRRAALLSRDLIGDYGAVSTDGQFLRSHLFPFFSWQEINARRYIRLFRNIAEEGSHAGRGKGWQWARGAKVGAGLGVNVGLSAAYRLAVAALLANAYFAATNLWNNLFFPTEEKELRRDNRSTHVIWGRNKDGSIRTVRIEGAFADFLQWFNLQDYPDDIKDLQSGKATVKDKLLDAAKAPINRIAQMWEPVSKTFFEAAAKRSTYPDFFKMRTIRDRGDYMAGQVSLGWLYRKVMDKPIRPTSMVIALLSYTTDPGEAAYYQVRETAGKWLEDRGIEGSAIIPSNRANALYYWKQAAKWGDEARAERWLKRYYELGGTRKGAKQSVDRGEPLAMMPLKFRQPFLRSLSKEDRETLDVATRWYHANQAQAALKTLPHVRPVRPKIMQLTKPEEDE